MISFFTRSRDVMPIFIPIRSLLVCVPPLLIFAPSMPVGQMEWTEVDKPLNGMSVVAIGKRLVVEEMFPLRRDE